jgi:hypothetical protein
MKFMPMVVVLTALMFPWPAGAQTVYVTDVSGKETKGRLVSWTGSGIVLQTDKTTKSFAQGEAVRVDLKGDSLKNGALIGAGVGAAIGGLTSGLADCEGCHGTRVTLVLVTMGMYSAIGTALDALISGRTPLWRAQASAHAGGSGLAINLSPQRRSAFVGWKIRMAR